jgi:anti-anti-sigma factor
MNIHMETDPRGEQTTIRLHGEFTVGAQKDLTSLLDLAQRTVDKRPPPKRVVIDLAAVNKIDSAGVGALFRLHMLFKPARVALRIANIGENARSALSVAGLDRLIEID